MRGVRGQIAASDGTAIASARVTLTATSFFGEVRSDAWGNYAFSGLADGVYTLGASARDRAYQEAQVTVTNGAASQSLTLGPETNAGAWATIGTSEPELFGGTNSGVVMPTGSLIFCHDTIDPLVFDPLTGDKHLVEQNATLRASADSEQGCHNLTHLADGRILYVGGGTVDDEGTFSTGQEAVNIVKAFDPVTEQWEVWPDLTEVRWYPGLARFEDGNLLLFGGGQQSNNPARNKQRTDTCELLDVESRTYTATGALTMAGGFGQAMLLQTGDIFLTWYPPQIYSRATGVWTNVANFVQPQRGYYWPGDEAGPQDVAVGDHPDFSAVMMPDGTVVAVGIWANAMSNPGSMVEIYDPVLDAWSLGSSPETIRAQTEVVLMPDLRIFVGAGNPQTESTMSTNTWGLTNAVELYDPATDAWRTMNSMQYPREYHAITLLLPDGRVLTQAGTGQPTLNRKPDDPPEIEAFSPPYLFRGPRPVIDSLSASKLTRGSEVTLAFSQTATPTAIRLMGMPAVTHFLDAGVPRVIDLDFTLTGNQATATLPTDPFIAMLGYYYLFVMVDDIPSEAKIVQVVSAE